MQIKVDKKCKDMYYIDIIENKQRRKKMIRNKLNKIISDGYNMEVVGENENYVKISIGGSEREIDKRSCVSDQINKYRSELGCRPLFNIDYAKIRTLEVAH